MNADADPTEFMRDSETRLRTAEVDAVTAFVAEADNLMALAGDIETCYDVLNEVESVLGKYQQNLGVISTDIKNLQSQSSKMHAQVENRRALQRTMGQFIHSITISHRLIHTIMESHVESDAFLESLRELDQKLKFVATNEQAKASSAYRDVAPELERLKVGAIGRGKDMILEFIRGLFRSKSVVGERKITNMTAVKAMIHFLASYGRPVYNDLRSAYVEKVSMKYQEICKGYWANIERHEEVRVTSEDLLGAPDPNASSVPSVAGVLNILSNLGGSGTSSVPSLHFFGDSKSSLSSLECDNTSKALSLGNRAKILTDAEKPPQVFSTAETSGLRFPFEVLFRSLSKLLTDIASHEYLLCTSIWASQGRAIYREVFQPSLFFIQASLGSMLQEVYDPLGILLALRINRQHALQMARRSLPALDDHFDAINMLLWPRLKYLLDRQLESLKTVPHDALDSVQAIRVHPISERYAALTSALLALHGEFVDGPLAGNIERMRYSVMDLLLRLSRSFAQRGRGTVFLIHNFRHILNALKDLAEQMPLYRDECEDLDDIVLSPSSEFNVKSNNVERIPITISSSGVQSNSEPLSIEEINLGSAGFAVLQAFEDSLQRAVSLYVEGRLTAGAPQLMTFVKRGEAAAANVAEGTPVPGYSPKEGTPVARDFSGRWEKIVEVLHKEIETDFGIGETGKEVQQSAFTQLLLVWSRFLDLMKRQGIEGVNLAQGAVAIPSIMFALKQSKYQF